MSKPFCPQESVKVGPDAETRRMKNPAKLSVDKVAKPDEEEYRMKFANDQPKSGGGSLNGQCGAVKRDGARCTLPAAGPHGLCWAHDPTNAEKRRKMASKAGRAKANREVALLKKELHTLKDNVLSGSVDRNDAAVVVQIYRTLKEFVELERRVKETDQLAADIEELKREYGAAG
jgi:hypothetical protein